MIGFTTGFLSQCFCFSMLPGVVDCWSFQMLIPKVYSIESASRANLLADLGVLLKMVSTPKPNG